MTTEATKIGGTETAASSSNGGPRGDHQNDEVQLLKRRMEEMSKEIGRLQAVQTTREVTPVASANNTARSQHPSAITDAASAKRHGSCSHAKCCYSGSCASE